MGAQSDSVVDLLTIRAEGVDEVVADRVDLFVDVTSDKLVTGDTALQKIPEVRALVSAAGQMGAATADVRLERVDARTEAGRGKDPCVYGLRVRLRLIGLLADALEAIATFEEVTLRRVEWGFPEDDVRRGERLAACARTANAKAAAAADALGMTVLGVHRFEVESQETSSHSASAPRAYSMKSSAKIQALELGLSHRATVTTKILVQYRVAKVHD